MNKQQAYKAFHNHDKESAFLGYSKSESDRWLTQISTGRIKNDHEQFKIF